MKKFLVLLTVSILFDYSGLPRNIPPLKIDFFHALPAAIDGCAATYTYDTTSLKKEKYIIVTNLQDMAFIRVGGKEIVLKQVSNTQLSQNANKEVYKGHGYTATLITKDVKQISDEVSYFPPTPSALRFLHFSTSANKFARSKMQKPRLSSGPLCPE